ncbi:hypothetical protein SALBM311S_03014 [Streptomyces alboniger]
MPLLSCSRSIASNSAGVDPSLVDAAKGIGMSRPMRLVRVELPLAWPPILTGIRVSTQMLMGIAAIAAYASGPGLGNVIFRGLASLGSRNALNQVLAGTLGIIVLALLFDAAYVLIGRLTIPLGDPCLSERPPVPPSSWRTCSKRTRAVPPPPSTASPWRSKRARSSSSSGRPDAASRTTLKMINRLIEPSGGRIRINGEDVTDMDPVRLRRQVGYAIQASAFPHMTVAQNIAPVPKMVGWPKGRIKDRVEEMLDLVGPGSRRVPRPLSASAVRRSAAAGGRGPGAGRTA